MQYDTNENPVEIAGSKTDSSENKNSVEKKSSKTVLDNDEVKESKFEWSNLFFFIIFIIEFFFCAMCVLSWSW